jgi:hypothetical protein
LGSKATSSHTSLIEECPQLTGVRLEGAHMKVNLRGGDAAARDCLVYPQCERTSHLADGLLDAEPFHRGVREERVASARGGGSGKWEKKHGEAPVRVFQTFWRLQTAFMWPVLHVCHKDTEKPKKCSVQTT